MTSSECFDTSLPRETGERKMRNQRVPFAIVLFVLSSVSKPTAFALFQHEMGPFPVKRMAIEKMPFTQQVKLEKTTKASELAKNSKTKKIKVLNSFDKEGRHISAGTVLSPFSNDEDNILIPVGITVTYPTEINGDLTIGRFAYLGDAPRFESSELEMVASKMGHTLRVKAWVTEARIAQYEFHLLNRFSGFYEAFMRDSMHFVGLKSIENAAKNATDPDLKKWYTVASYYSKHVLENGFFDVYQKTANPNKEDENRYKMGVLTSMLRYLMNDESMSLETGYALYQQYKSNPSFFQTRAKNSERLFKSHFENRYVVLPVEKQMNGRVGYLTFVYPIAIDVAGPFHQPEPGLKQFPAESEPEDQSTVNGRWWSNRWQDEFGGFPFIPITEDGVAFHGPISLFSPESSSNSDATETWFLRRDNVSHSCMRMDPSDVLELRALLPGNLSQLSPLGKTIPLQIIEWPDVTDLKGDGKLEIVDVAYYIIPSDGGDIKDPASYLPEVYNKTYWKRYLGVYASKLPAKKGLRIESRAIINPVTGQSHMVNEGYLTGLPHYEIKKRELVQVGNYNEELPIFSLPMRPSAIIQYQEDGIKYKNPFEGGIDYYGNYPPSYFARFY